MKKLGGSSVDQAVFREKSIKLFEGEDMCEGAKVTEGRLGPKCEVILTLRQRVFAFFPGRNGAPLKMFSFFSFSLNKLHF